MSDLKRRETIPLIGPFFALLLKLTGCGGGGGGGVPQQTQTTAPFIPPVTPTPANPPSTPTDATPATPSQPQIFTFFIAINGVSQTIRMTSANPTALEATKAATVTAIDGSWPDFGQFVKTLNRETFDARQEGVHWKLYVNNTWSNQAADRARLNLNDRVDWRKET
ncbi:MAG: DUF4430 domain-containing protein [Patescibacteria group bacterium]